MGCGMENNLPLPGKSFACGPERRTGPRTPYRSTLNSRARHEEHEKMTRQNSTTGRKPAWLEREAPFTAMCQVSSVDPFIQCGAKAGAVEAEGFIEGRKI